MYNDIYTGDVQDKRFFGIYRGVVVDSNDPASQGRIRMLVPQVLGEAVTGWAYPISGIPVSNKTPYISVIDTTNQPASMPGTAHSTPINTAIPVSLSTTLESYGIDIVDDTKMKFKYSGIYNVQFSFQFVSTNASLQKVQIWLKQNEDYVPQSNGQITISGNGASSLPAWNYVLSLKAGDYLQFYWATNSVDVYIASNPTALDNAPHIPGVIATAVLAGGYTPGSGDGCWVMFEGGDPNFPLWLGAF